VEHDHLASQDDLFLTHKREEKQEEMEMVDISQNFFFTPIIVLFCLLFSPLVTVKRFWWKVISIIIISTAI